MSVAVGGGDVVMEDFVSRRHGSNPLWNIQVDGKV